MRLKRIMLPTSVRRVVSAAAPHSTPGLPHHHPAAAAVSLALSHSSAAASASGSSIGHQRRYSSSKPSSPDNGSKDLPSGDGSGESSVPSSSSSGSGDSRPTMKLSGLRRKRKAKEPSEAAARVPSVPSTQHLSQEGMHPYLSTSSVREGLENFCQASNVMQHHQHLRSRASSPSTDPYR